MFLDIKNKNEIIKKIGKNIKDSGSSSVQICFLTYKINFLKNHFLKHKKDYHSKRGLLKMVSKRKRLLIYLKNKNISKYNNIIKMLNLRS